MPMTVARSDWARWLDPGAKVDVHHILAPATALRLDAYPVSTAVNSVRNNGPGSSRGGRNPAPGMTGQVPALPTMCC
jgi:putative SOS response-associated peptidase YedK